MNKKKNPPLKELVDLHELQLIQDSFAETVGTSSVIFSSDCEPLTEFSNPTGFCSLIQSTDAGKQRCFQSFQEMVEGALESGEPKIMYCFAHGGHFVAPIIIDGKHKGTMFAGQFIPSEFSEGQLDDIRQIAGDIGLDPELLHAKAERMRVVTEDSVRNYSSLLFRIVGVIAKMGSQAGELRQAGDALQKAHNGLEKRVQERTAELAEANAGLQHEIAERKSAEESLREGEERFRMMFENMSNAVAVYESANEGNDFIFKDLNRAGEKIDNLKREDLIGKSVLDVFPGVVEFGLFDVFRRVWQTGEPEHCPISLYTDEKIVGWRENYAYKLPSGEIVAIYDDVTEQKQMEESLAESEEKHRTLVETLTDLVFIIDLEGRFTYLSPIFEDITGYPVRDFIGRSFTEVIVPEYIEQTVNRFKQGVSGEEIPLYEIELVHKDKKSVPVELNVTSLLNVDGEVVGRTGTARDITERKELEQQLQQAFDKLKASYEELSIPVIQVWDGVLVLPIIGVLDSERINRLMETMLAKIVETQSGVVIIDVTGVRSVDTNVANHLINVAKAAKLLGTRCVVTGIKPDVAHTLIGLGVDMSGVTTMRSMQEGLKYALQIAGAGVGVDA
ncbi:MAG: PAS domain S-box protein [Methanosarcinales archaeon]|nr:MAG: PAS domain S-box protein [Methanosarcinales archaeon]